MSDRTHLIKMLNKSKIILLLWGCSCSEMRPKLVHAVQYSTVQSACNCPLNKQQIFGKIFVLSAQVKL